MKPFQLCCLVFFTKVTLQQHRTWSRFPDGPGTALQPLLCSFPLLSWPVLAFSAVRAEIAACVKMPELS